MNAFVQTILDALQNEKLNKRTTESIALKYGITDKTLIKEFIELAIVLKAREIANTSQTISEKFTEIVNLYQNQVNLSHRTSQSIMLQQYSTPAPISYLAGVYVLHNQPKDYQIFEPSAGNGLLTIAFNPKQVLVNEVDENRYNNLKLQDFMQVMRVDATRNLALEHSFYSLFDGIITNPPFGTLDEPMKIGEYRINHLDHAMAIRALDCMKDTGRASIIIGGHTNYDDKGRVQSGKNRIFLSYLYSHYNVEDIINIDGSLYSRQGTSFDVRLILINGRKVKPDGFPPLKTEDSEPIKDFNSLFDRVTNLFENNQANKRQSTSFHNVKEGDYVEIYTGITDKQKVAEGKVRFKYGKHYLKLDNDNTTKYDKGFTYYIVDFPKSKEPWRMRRDEYIKSINAKGYWAETSAISDHEFSVRKAVECNKKVPKEVLRDYENLKKLSIAKAKARALILLQEQNKTLQK